MLRSIKKKTKRLRSHYMTTEQFKKTKQKKQKQQHKTMMFKLQIKCVYGKVQRWQSLDRLWEVAVCVNKSECM